MMKPRTAKPSPARSLQELVDRGALSAVTDELRAVAAQFSVSITPAMLDLIDPAETQDPIAAQFVPSDKELAVQATERADPIGDQEHSPVEGIV